VLMAKPYLCKDCGTTEPERFYRRSKSRCNQCYTVKIGLWKKNNPDKVRQYSQKYRKNNIDKVRQREQEYRDKNREANLDKRRQYAQKYLKENRDKINARARMRKKKPNEQARKRLRNCARTLLGARITQITDQQRKVLFYRRLFMLVFSGELSYKESRAKIREFDNNPSGTLLSLFYMKLVNTNILKGR